MYYFIDLSKGFVQLDIVAFEFLKDEEGKYVTANNLIEAMEIVLSNDKKLFPVKFKEKKSNAK